MLMSGSGGVQPYLKHIYGDAFGFLAAWTWIVAVMPATLAILSIVFVETIYSAAGVTDQADRLEHKLLSVFILALITVANSISTKASTRLNNFFVVVKFVTIAAIVVAGLGVVIAQLVRPDREDIGGRDWFTNPWFGYRETVTPDGDKVDWAKIGQWEMFGHYSAGLYGALWGYSGWDKVSFNINPDCMSVTTKTDTLQAIYVSAELSAPARQLPLAINTSIPTIILCFLTANAAYYILLPWDVISRTDSVAVVSPTIYLHHLPPSTNNLETAITRLLGPAFGIVAAVFICLVVAGSLLGNSFVAGRMAVAAANKSWLPRFLGLIGRVRTAPAHVPSEGDAGIRKDTKSDAPINALILSAVLSAFYILLGNFRALLTFNGLGEYTFFFLTVIGAVVLRFREPNLHRPYKPPILTPVIFAVVSGFVVVRGAVFAPVQAAVLAGVWVVGLGFYWARKIWSRRQ